MLMVVNEGKQKMRQRSLFGGTVKYNAKSYCIYKNPDRDFESVAVLFTGKEENQEAKQGAGSSGAYVLEGNQNR